ncbi:MAG: hypothetical protein JXR49_10160, partial [Acidobacteria bacterium]|nr:hypothetical protein [Acidobacteriota bacterium]
MKKLKMNNWPLLVCLTLFCALSVSICRAEETPMKPINVVSLEQAHKGDLKIDTLLLDSFGRPPEERR